MPEWTTVDKVQAQLGPGVPFASDPAAQDDVDAANAWAFRKRRQAGYVDDPDPAAPAPSADVALGTTLYARDLWRERQSTDGFQSFEDFGTFAPTGGALGRIRQLLGIGKAQVDAAPAETAELAARRRRRRLRVTW